MAHLQKNKIDITASTSGMSIMAGPEHEHHNRIWPKSLQVFQDYDHLGFCNKPHIHNGLDKMHCLVLMRGQSHHQCNAHIQDSIPDLDIMQIAICAQTRHVALQIDNHVTLFQAMGTASLAVTCSRLVLA